MRQLRTFEAFGRKYRTRQFAAIPAFGMMAYMSFVQPQEMLASTEALGDTQWYSLAERDCINDLVTDGAGILPPIAVLRGVMNLVKSHNFGFLDGWTSAKVPKRFTSDATPVTSEHVDPVIMHLVQKNKATIRELEEYYSLEDAFKMFDIIVVEGVNAALVQEDAEKQAKAKRR